MSVKFIAGPWEAGTRAGTFARFFEAHAMLAKDDFVAKLPRPHLVIGAEPDPATWDEGIVVRLEPRTGSADAPVVIGRGADSDVVLHCPTISSRHVEVSRVEGRWRARDLGAKAGTFVDGKPLAASESVVLEGERPRLGIGPDVEALFLAPEALHAFVAEALARRRAAPGAPRHSSTKKKNAWPTWSLLQEPASKTPTASELPVLQIEALGTAKLIEPADVGTRATGVRSLIATRQNLAITIATIVIVLAVAAWGWRPLALALFGGTHPEWFMGPGDHH